MSTSDYASGPALTGLKVLALLPPTKDAEVLLRLLEAAKAQWRWQIDVLCLASDRPKLEKPARTKIEALRCASGGRMLQSELARGN